MMNIEIVILKSENGPLTIKGYKIPHGYYYVIDLISYKVLFSSKNLNESILFKSNLLQSYERMGKKTLALACSEQFLQTGTINPVVFLMDPLATNTSGGFEWRKSILGYIFWLKVLHKEEYYLANVAYDKALEILREENRLNKIS